MGPNCDPFQSPHSYSTSLVSREFLHDPFVSHWSSSQLDFYTIFNPLVLGGPKSPSSQVLVLRFGGNNQGDLALGYRLSLYIKYTCIQIYMTHEHTCRSGGQND